MLTRREMLIKKTVEFCSEYMPYDMMDVNEQPDIPTAEIAFTKHLTEMTVNELLSSVKSMLDDDLDADMSTLQEAWDNVIIEMIAEESITILGERSLVSVVRGIKGKTNWMLKVKHNDVSFTHILIQHGDLYKILTHSMSVLVGDLGEIKDIEQRASYWEIYCFLNIFDWRWKFIWS